MTNENMLINDVKKPMNILKMSDMVNPHFGKLWNTKCPYVIAKGGRGSFKSSVISLWLVLAMKQQTQEQHHVNIICIRENQA